MKQNYQIILDKTLENIKKDGIRPSLLLHACCAPCSSYVLEYLSSFFKITICYYNPNIFPKEEYDKRYEELRRLVLDMELDSVDFVDSDYEPEKFFELVRGLEHLPERSERCRLCYAQRLERTAKIAAECKFDYFTTTLSISPYKNADWLCEIGGEMAEKYGAKYLYSDFKKRGGYKRSTELSQKFGLYRQDFCGCVFSQRDKKS